MLLRTVSRTAAGGLLLAATSASALEAALPPAAVQRSPAEAVADRGPAPKAAAPKAGDAVPEPVKVSDDPRPTFGPGTFVATMNAADRYRAIADGGGWGTVPNAAASLKPGDRGSALAALRARLAAEGDLPADAAPADGFDPATAAALRRFQFRHGLEETGLVGPRTLAALNVPASVRLGQLQASAARLLGSRFAFGERYVVVNIPAQAVEAVANGAVVRRHVAVIGKADRPSPTVETRITSVNFNPTWTAPVSVIRRDIIPHMRKDPGYLARMKIRIFDGNGQEIAPTAIDWSTERAVNYTLRQDAGAENSLGAVRIDMPNRHAVYMHDTPSKRLFARSRRLQSSGCVRVAGVKDLVGWLLEGTAPTPAPLAATPAQPGAAAPLPAPAAAATGSASNAGTAGPAPGAGPAGWGAAEIDAAIASGKRTDVRLSRAVPVAWVYLTGYATADGTVHFRDDVYGLDSPPAAAAAPGADAPAPGRDARPLTIRDLVTSSVTPAR